MQYALFSRIPFPDNWIYSFNIAVNADNVFPDPVGELIRVFSLQCIFIIENFCGGENSRPA